MLDADFQVRLLQDTADIWGAIRACLSSSVRVVGDAGPDVIGVVGWQRASIEEVACLGPHRKEHHGPIVAVVTEMPSARGCRALNALVDGSLLVSELEPALMVTLSALSAGQCVFPRALRANLERPMLSSRERQVLAMVVLDFSNAEIADKLVVTESSVKNHLTSAFQKLGVTSRAEAAGLILDHESGLGTGVLRILPKES